MVEENNFETHSFQMLYIDFKKYTISSTWLKKIFQFIPCNCSKLTLKRTWFLHYDWRKFWDSVLPNACNWPQKLTKSVIHSEQMVSRIHAEKRGLSRIAHASGFTHSRRKYLNFTHSRRKKGPFMQSRRPMGGLIKTVNHF